MPPLAPAPDGVHGQSGVHGHTLGDACVCVATTGVTRAGLQAGRKAGRKAGKQAAEQGNQPHDSTCCWELQDRLLVLC